MTANVDVIVGEADNVLHVPTAAVTGSGSNATVTVLQNGAAGARPGRRGPRRRLVDRDPQRPEGQRNHRPSVRVVLELGRSTGGASTTSTTGGAARFRGGGAGVFGGLGG